MDATLPHKSSFEEPREPRQRPENVKDRIVKERGYKNIRTVSEQVAEFTYRPVKCKNAVSGGGGYVKTCPWKKGSRFYSTISGISSLSPMTGSGRPREIVYFAHARCDHENDIEQLKNGVKAMTWPVHDLVSNWAYMVIAALAWNLKAWLGLLTPNASLRHQILRMEFKRFIHTFILIPCLIIKTGRRIVYRLLGYQEYLKEFLKTFEDLRGLRLAG